MEQIATKFSQLRSRLESVAFLVAQEGAAKEAHKEIVKSLILLSELESAYPITVAVEVNIEEVNKVGRRLKLWIMRPNQINSKILTAYLKLERAGASTITEDDLKRELVDETSFESNFAQMKIIAKKNHGKVFEQYGAKITLWPPVASKVREYEKYVFGNK